MSYSVEQEMADDIADELAIDRIDESDALQWVSNYVDDYTEEHGSKFDADKLHAYLTRRLAQDAKRLATTIVEAATYMRDGY